MKSIMRATLISAACLAAASCRTAAGVEPCDVLVDIPAAPAAVNRVLVTQARPTAEGIARNQARVARYRCRRT